MSNQIQEKINKIIEKRKEEIKRLYDNISGSLFYWCDIGRYKIKPKFFKFLKKKQKLSKEQLKCIKNLRYCNNHYMKFHKQGYPEKLNQKKWELLKWTCNHIIKYQEEYLEIIKKKELLKLTNCLRSLEGINPCEKICLKCDITYSLNAQYCSKCGNTLQ